MLMQAFTISMKKYLSLVKFSHTIFALPFALLGFSLGFVQYYPDNWLATLIKVILCMVFARSAAMAFNRYVDREIDQKNPRTRVREIPSGQITARNALIFVIVNTLLFVATTYTINPLCFYLSPVALIVILGYSYTKRFTALCHLILGLGLALAPVGAYLAVAGSFHLVPILYGIVVLTWVAGFDIIYAMQDVGFDKGEALYSIPVWAGGKKALTVSVILHVVCGLFLIWAGFEATTIYPSLAIIHWIGTGLFIALLVYQHLIVGPDKLDRVNLAFFTTNGFASLLFAICFIVDLIF